MINLRKYLSLLFGKPKWQKTPLCFREETNDIDAEWRCHRCQSQWSDEWSGVGWLPLSCPLRRLPSYDPQPGKYDDLKRAKTGH